MIAVAAAADREELRRLLHRDGMLRADSQQPIRGRDGTSVPWMFYSWNCTLTGRGAMLAGRCLVDRLRHFRSTQLASFGYTGIPLLTACIRADDAYTGLVIRDVRKAYGSMRQIEGPADKSRPVVVIDDSLSSGTSLRKAIQTLEEEGFEVEGAVVLVNFPFRGGLEWAAALGYRVEALFDAWEDLGAPRPSFVPGHLRFASERWAEEALPDGLHPAVAAREAATFYLRHGRMPRPPGRFDADYDGCGGVYVSFRERHSDHRLARDGFWHFDPRDADPQRDLVLATVKTVKAAPGAITLTSLPDLKIAASFFTALERIVPGKLDFSRYGIVARSRGSETKMGGALPNSQVFTSEIEQYTHARWRNARIPSCEPHDLYRHEIRKCVEPGEYWLPFGSYQDPASHWASDIRLGRMLTERAHAIIEASASGTVPAGDPLADDLIPAPVYAIAVTLYRRGVRGCYVTWGGTLDSCLIRAATKALSDSRFADAQANASIDGIDVAVSVLHDREWHGESSLDRAALKLRLGADSMSVQHGDRRGFLLASVAPHFNLTKEQFAKELLRKASITEPPYRWSTYHTATWLRSAHGTHKIVSGFPERATGDVSPPNAFPPLLAGYILNSLGSKGLPDYYYAPVTGERVRDGSPARLIHALAALEEAGRSIGVAAWREAGMAGIRHCLSTVLPASGKATLFLGDHAPNAMADCQLLATAAASDADVVVELAARVRSMFQPDGRITDTPRGLGVASEHDYLPGAALLAMARFIERQPDDVWLAGLSSHLHWYRRRWRLLHPWGMVGWQAQAWEAVHALTRDAEHAAFVFELADWALDWQHERSGAFITDLSPTGPSFHTAFIAEGIAAAWRVARRLGDDERAARYERSCADALDFMRRLVILPQDTYCMRDPARAVGGVRSTLITTGVRVDFVSHTLLAFVRSPQLQGSIGVGSA